MESREYELKLLTPCFCAGADPNKPEIRAPSIRGHLRRWHARLYGHNDVKSVWGGIGKGGGASKIQLRVIVSPSESRKTEILPHKGNEGGYRQAQTCDFTVLISSRDHVALEKAACVVELWSLLGGLGGRSNRAAGSIWPSVQAPGNLNDFKQRLNGLGWSKGEVYVSEKTEKPAILRRMASDTLEKPDLFGSVRPERRESPIKMKVIEFSDGLHLLLFSEHQGLIEKAIRVLNNASKPLSRTRWLPLLGTKVL
jgi:hypothetical protein